MNGLIIRGLILGACGYSIGLIFSPITVPQMLLVALVCAVVYTVGMYAGDHALRTTLLDQESVITELEERRSSGER